MRPTPMPTAPAPALPMQDNSIKEYIYLLNTITSLKTYDEILPILVGWW
jgi:hypothetical protein